MAASTLEYGTSKRGKRTLIYGFYEYWLYKTNNEGETLWRCTKYQTFSWRASVKTPGDNIVAGNECTMAMNLPQMKYPEVNPPEVNPPEVNPPEVNLPKVKPPIESKLKQKKLKNNAC